MTNYTEWTDSQKPALALLKKLGWDYLAYQDILKSTLARYAIVDLVGISATLENQLSRNTW